MEGKYFFQILNPSVGVPVCRVSDEEVFWASMADRPRAARKPVRAKNRRSRGWSGRRKMQKVIANKGRIQIGTLPLVWRGMWRGSNPVIRTLKHRPVL